MGEGQRVEVKNITGFRGVEEALNYEVVRQESMARLGVVVERETRHYDAEAGTTHSLRKKEHEEDYGYIVEPDLVKIELSREWVERLEAEMPELPDRRIERFVEQYGIPRFQSGIMVNAGLDLSEFFEVLQALREAQRGRKLDSHIPAEEPQLRGPRPKGVKGKVGDIRGAP